MARPALVAMGAVLIAAGGVALAVALTHPAQGGLPPETMDRVTALVADIDQETNSLQIAVLDRAGQLGSLPQIQAVVMTDAETAKDMSRRSELGFQLEPGEVIEFGAVPKRGQRPRFTDRVIFLLQPEHAEPSRTEDLLLGASTSWLEDCDGQVPSSCATVVYTTVYQVTPRQRSDELAGYLRVSRRFDLKPAAARLAAAGVDARFGARRATPPGWLELATTALSGIACFVKLPPSAGGVAIALGGAAVASVGLILLVAGMLGKRAREATTTTAQRLGT